jgi:hypothetical protein
MAGFELIVGTFGTRCRYTGSIRRSKSPTRRQAARLLGKAKTPYCTMEPVEVITENTSALSPVCRQTPVQATGSTRTEAARNTKQDFAFTFSLQKGCEIFHLLQWKYMRRS